MSQLLQNAAYGTAMILAVAALRRVLRDRLVPEARLALWAVCLFRLLTPAAPESVWSLWGLFQAPPAPAPVSPTPGGPDFSSAPQLYAPAQANPGIPWEKVLLAAWLAVGAALAARYVLSWRRTRRAVACAIPLDKGDPRYAPLPKFARLREGVMEGAPLTFGAVRPTVVLSPGLEGAELDCVLAHEGVHAARRDNLWHYVMALAVHWWNPAVWLLSRLLRRDIELSCDRAALKKLGTDRRADYANALVTLATQAEGPNFCQTFGRKAAEERILSIMKFKKMTAFSAILSALLVCSVSVAFATDAIENQTGSIATSYAGGEIFMDLSPQVDEPLVSTYGNEAELGYTFTELDYVDETAIEPRDIDLSTDFNVNVGESFKRSFNMSVWFNDPHTNFRITVRNTNNVPYKVIILNDEGYERVVGDRTGDCTLVVGNASTTARYTVYITNVGTKVLSGHVTISSYY